mgnify:CR=1 FL=1
MSVAVSIGIIGYAMSAEGVIPNLKDSETIIVQIAHVLSTHGIIFAIIAGVILAGILASTMSTSDSQLLAASSAASENIIGGLFRIKLSETAQMIVARVTLIAISVIGVVILGTQIRLYSALFRLRGQASAQCSVLLCSFPFSGRGQTATAHLQV